MAVFKINYAGKTTDIIKITKTQAEVKTIVETNKAAGTLIQMGNKLINPENICSIDKLKE